MKNIPFITASILAVSLIPSLLHADVVIVQETVMGDTKTKTTMSVKGDKVRTDTESGTSMIMDTKTGDATTLMHEQKMMMKMNMKAMQAAAPKEEDKDAKKPEAPKITATGKKEKVDGYECEIYTSESEAGVVKFWMAKDYPDAEKIKKEMEVMTKMAGAGAQKTPDIPGLMVKSEFENAGVKVVTKVLSAKVKDVSEEIFEVPAGYKAPGE